LENFFFNSTINFQKERDHESRRGERAHDHTPSEKKEREETRGCGWISQLSSSSLSALSCNILDAHVGKAGNVLALLATLLDGGLDLLLQMGQKQRR
jgi:hypothetical protein